MTAKEKKVYGEWNRKMAAQGDLRDTYFEEMRTMCQTHGGGKAPFSLQFCFEYLMTSNDKNVRGRAIAIFEKYQRAAGQFDALLELGQAFADIK